MQTISAHGCIDLCVCRHRFVVPGALDTCPHHLLLGYHGTGIPRNANRDIATKGWVTKRANGAGETYSEGRTSRLWERVVSGVVGGPFPCSLHTRGDWLSCCWDSLPCGRRYASFPIHTGRDSLLSPQYGMVVETMRQYINARRILVHIQIKINLI